MCINCGCKMPADDMGHPHNITIRTLALAAVAEDQDGATTLRHIKETLEMVTPEELDAEIEKVKSEQQDSEDNSEAS